MASPCIAWLFSGVGVKNVGTCASPNQGEAHVPTLFTLAPLNKHSMQGEAMQPAPPSPASTSDVECPVPPSPASTSEVEWGIRTNTINNSTQQQNWY